MNLLICSDIHGDAKCLERVLNFFNESKAEKLVILGDILYHGPRNDLPEGYAPKKVITMLNEISDRIIAIRGNCDTEVDQMVLNFPILSESSYIFADGLTMFLTHGHKFTQLAPPPISHGTVMLSGHTHVLKIEEFGNGNTYINPGSVSLPKENNPKTFILYCDRKFSVIDLDGNTVTEKSF